MKKLFVLLLLLAMAGIASAELLSDGGFESGMWDGTGGWFYAAYPNSYTWQYGSMSLTSDAHSGNNALKAHMMPSATWAYTYSYAVTYGSFNFVGSTSGWLGCWDDGIAVTGGDVLKATAWVKDADGTSAAGIAKLQMEWYDDSGNRDWDNEVYQYFDVEGDWTQVTMIGTVPMDAVTMHMYVGIGTWGVGRNTLFDDVSVTIIPEPMSIALLGLGGLFLRRRKA
jgi:hypothetical protein